MKENLYRVFFKCEGTITDIYAENAECAMILAQAEQIKAGRNYQVKQVFKDCGNNWEIVIESSN